MNLSVNEDLLEVLRPLFTAVEGNCEVWTDDEIVRRLFIRGAMEYAKSAGKSWDETMALAGDLRNALA
ncbi:MAG: hypothetical protein GEU74_01155 [Nitriliruptorales bacterium]|nr:hypothetical protein [Nitriliruptorales bacterium]